jgi:hypothetical protein
MQIVIDRQSVIDMDLTETRSHVVNMEGQFDTGPQPYKLYAYLSTLFNDTTILDVGTEWGNSALCLAYNPNNHVMSYDIEYKDADTIEKENITFKIMDFMQDETISWDNVSIIMIDVDPHDGIQEPVMLQFLKDKGWKGLLILDDIGDMFQDMKHWFATIEDEKWELDHHIGHYSGTGVVNFGNIHQIIFTSSD